MRHGSPMCWRPDGGSGLLFAAPADQVIGYVRWPGPERVGSNLGTSTSALLAGRAETARGDSQHIRINRNVAGENASGWAER
jgi:hypothetical protein